MVAPPPKYRIKKKQTEIRISYAKFPQKCIWYAGIVSPAFLLAMQKFLLQRQKVYNICLIYGWWGKEFCFIRDQSFSYVYDILISPIIYQLRLQLLNLPQGWRTSGWTSVALSIFSLWVITIFLVCSLPAWPNGLIVKVDKDEKVEERKR